MRLKHPVIFQVLLFFGAVIAAGAASAVLAMFGFDPDTSGGIARILTGVLLLLTFHKLFVKGRACKGMIYACPVFAFAVFNILNHFLSGASSLGEISIRTLILAIAPAVFEEVLFRGIFTAHLGRKYSDPMKVLLLSAAVFSLVHLTNLLGMDLMSNLVQLAVSLAVGLSLGAAYLVSKDLVSVILVHAAIDFTSTVFPGSGSTPAAVFVIWVLLTAAECIYGVILVKKHRNEIII